MKEKHDAHPPQHRRRRRARPPFFPIILALLIGLALGLAASVEIESVVQGDGDSEINIYFGLVNIIDNDESENATRVFNITTVDESENSPVTVDINAGIE